MNPEEALTIINVTQPLAKIEHARAFLAEAADRGLSPFTEIWPIFAEKKEKRGDKWIPVGIKNMTFKEHYNIAARWAQQCGGYSTPYRETRHETRTETGYNDRQYQVSGVYVKIGVLTNQDYAALIKLAGMNIPGFDFREEREAFVKWGEAFVSDKHPCPSGKDAEWVARKRATEEALLNAFGREPSQARQMYALAMSAEDTRAAADAMFPAPAPQAALPAPIEGEYREAESAATPPTVPEQHWIDNPKTRAAFWARAAERGLSREDVHEALGVASVHDFTGTLQEAGAALTAWIEAQSTLDSGVLDKACADAQPIPFEDGADF